MPPIQRIAVIGAGAWGTALAKHLAEKGLSVTLWAYEREVLDSIVVKRENQLFLPGVTLPPSLKMTNVLSEAVHACDGLLFVVPSHVARLILQQLGPLLSHPVPIVSATKGVEEDTFKLMTEVITDVLVAQRRMRELNAAGVPAARVRTLGEFLREAPGKVTLPLFELPQVKTPGLGFELAQDGQPDARGAPALGADNAELLR